MNVYRDCSFRRFWLFVRIQSRTSLRTASLLVRAAINDLLKILFTILSHVKIWGLGIRRVLIFDDSAWEVWGCYNGRGICGASSN